MVSGRNDAPVLLIWQGDDVPSHAQYPSIEMVRQNTPRYRIVLTNT